MRTRVMVAQPYLGASGGCNVVAAWALQALRQDFQVTLATLGPVDHEAVNRSFGTTLRQGDFAIRIAPRGYLALSRTVPTQGALMEICVTARWARELIRPRELPRRAQHNQRNGFRTTRPVVCSLPLGVSAAAGHRNGLVSWHPPAYWGRTGACADGMRRNLSMANSAFVAGKIEEVSG